MYQLLITAGILASFLINTLIRNLTFTGAEGQNPADFLITDVSISWRTMLFVTLIPSSIFLLGVLFLPRSPRWLISVGRHQEALTVLKKIRNSDEEGDSEAREISDTVAAGNTSGGGFSMFRTNSNFRRTVYLGITLQLLQQLCGRDFGITCSTCANWFSNMAIATTFLPLTTLQGNSGTMAVYAVCSAAAIFLIWAFVPETKGVSLERFEKNLMAGVKLRDIGRND